ncbi:hypothetical protein DV737_g1208, partial [Chaetothyriales sp. CBS 132003]
MTIVVPDGQRPPFAVVTNQDHVAWILATAIIQTGLVLGACAKGLGKSLDLLSASSQMTYASALFAYITLGLSKASVVLFLLRLSLARRHRITFYTATGVICAWTVASLFAMGLQCELGHPWRTIAQACRGTTLRLVVISAFDIIIEVSLVGLALFLVWGLQTSLSTKASIVFVFAFRLPMLVPIAFRLSNSDSSAWVKDPLLLQAPYYIWTQTELVYSVVSATIPTLRPLIRNLNTQFGGLSTSESGNSYGNGTGSKGLRRTFLRLTKRTTAGRSERRSQQTGNDENGVEMHRPTRTGPSNQGIASSEYEAAVAGGGAKTKSADSTSMTSHDSRQMIIKKSILWDVRHETR